MLSVNELHPAAAGFRGAQEGAPRAQSPSGQHQKRRQGNRAPAHRALSQHAQLGTRQGTKQRRSPSAVRRPPSSSPG